MSDTELYLSSDPDLLGLLVGLVELAVFLLACWVVVHPHMTWTYLRVVYRRGCAYRRSVRSARHVARRPLVRRTAR